MQEETTALGIPCITIRENTERPVTITEGTNQLVGTDRDKIVKIGKETFEGNGKSGSDTQILGWKNSPKNS